MSDSIDLRARVAAGTRGLVIWSAGCLAFVASAAAQTTSNATSAPASAGAPGAAAASVNASGWQYGLVLDVAATSRATALGARDKGLSLGHSDLSAFGPVGRHLQAQVTVAAHAHEGKVEAELEEAWLQTRSLPGGLQVRAGRFASQIGYLNEQHPHADDFVERPLLYRAFLGNHWNDDGVRLNWTAPTDLYLRLGAEVFRGKRLVQEAATDHRPAVTVLSARTGGDLGTAHSWQAGLSWVHNRREAAIEEEEAEAEAGHSHDHAGHVHGSAFSGKRMAVLDLTWKWAPSGNNSREQLRVSFEHARVTGLNRYARSSDRHHASYLAAVWRFASVWEVGARTDVLRARMPHDDHFHDGRLREHALMLAYKPGHSQSLRLQFTRQRNGTGFPQAANAVSLHYVISFGAHAAHSF